MKKLSSAVALLAVAGVVLSGCSASGDGSDSSEKSDSKNEQTVTFSTGTQFPPMGYVEDGELIGFDIDLGNALGERAGVNVKWQESLFNQFLSDVKSERTDGIMGAMLDTTERQESITFIDYLESGFQFFTLKDVAEDQGISEISDLCGLTVAASRNSSYADSINEWSGENCDGNDITVLDTDGSPDALLQLKQGRAQAVMQTNEAIAYMVSNDDTLQTVGDPITSSFYGLGFAKDDTETLDLFVDAFEGMIEDGSYQEIADKWDISDQAVDEVTVNLEGR